MALTGVSDNAGGVKHVSTTLLHAPVEERHFALMGNAAAPDASLRFLFYGGLVILPVVTVYTLRVYWIFRGKVRRAGG